MMCCDLVINMPLAPPKRRQTQYPARNSASTPEGSGGVPCVPGSGVSGSRAAAVGGSDPAGRHEEAVSEAPATRTELRETSVESGQAAICRRFVCNSSMLVLLRAQLP